MANTQQGDVLNVGDLILVTPQWNMRGIRPFFKQVISVDNATGNVTLADAAVYQKHTNDNDMFSDPAVMTWHTVLQGLSYHSFNKEVFKRLSNNELLFQEQKYLFIKATVGQEALCSAY